MIDGLPVLGEEPLDVERPRAVSRALALRLAAPMQALTAGIGGFLVGVVAVGLLNRRQGRGGGRALVHPKRGRVLPGSPRRRISGRRAERRGARGPAGELLQVVASRSLLLDVHLLGSPDNER